MLRAAIAYKAATYRHAQAVLFLTNLLKALNDDTLENKQHRRGAVMFVYFCLCRGQDDATISCSCAHLLLRSSRSTTKSAISLFTLLSSCAQHSTAHDTSHHEPSVPQSAIPRAQPTRPTALKHHLPLHPG